MNQLVSERRGGNRLINQARTGGARPPRISIDNGRFTLIVPGVAPIEGSFDGKGAFIDIVIVGANPHVSKLYWGPRGDGGRKVFDRANPSPPICTSDNGVAPSITASAPQSPTCAACPHNVWGSAIGFNGGKVKACEDMKKFSAIVRGQPGVYLFEIKGGSFRAWNAYTGMLSMHKLPQGGAPDLCDVVTRVRFAGTGLLAFEPVELVAGALADAVLAITNEMTDVIVNRLDPPAPGVLPIEDQKAAQARGMPAQAPMPPPQPEQPFVLSGEAPAGPLFPQQPAQVEAEQPKRGRPKKVETPQVQPAPPAQPERAIVTSTGMIAGVQTPSEGLPSDISSRLQSLFPTAKP